MDDTQETQEHQPASELKPTAGFYEEVYKRREKYDDDPKRARKFELGFLLLSVSTGLPVFVRQNGELLTPLDLWPEIVKQAAIDGQPLNAKDEVGYKQVKRVLEVAGERGGLALKPSRAIQDFGLHVAFDRQRNVESEETLLRDLNGIISELS